MNTTRRRIAGTVIFLALIIAFCYWQVYRFADSGLLNSHQILFTLPAGAGRAALAERLVQQKLIVKEKKVWLYALLKLKPQLATFKAGTYQFQPAMKVKDMLTLLASGKEAQFPVRLIEGARLQEWLAELRRAPHIRHTLADDHPVTLASALAVNNSGELEGWFYPDTWLYTANTSDVALLKRAHQMMVALVNQVWETRMDNLPYKTKNELVTMASIIEKETALSDERTKVASVFVNRLRCGMRLQTDPTVIYGLGEKYQGRLSRKDLETASAYNTYLISGLPPHPIAIPGRASLEAAAHPSDTPYLYFVADGKGGHTFSRDLSSHNQAVRYYRQVLKEENEK